jgi:hypothetical protein
MTEKLTTVSTTKLTEDLRKLFSGTVTRQSLVTADLLRADYETEYRRRLTLNITEEVREEQRVRYENFIELYNKLKRLSLGQSGAHSSVKLHDQFKNLTLEQTKVKQTEQQQDKTPSESESESETEEILIIMTEVEQKKNLRKAANETLHSFGGELDKAKAFYNQLEIFIEEIPATLQDYGAKLVKSYLTGEAALVITNEATAQEILNKLQEKIKGESKDTIELKLMSIKQGNKSAKEFVKEIEEVTKQLRLAHIAQGLSSETAKNYAETTAIRTLTHNVSNHKIEAQLQGNTFPTLEAAVAKFTDLSTSAKNETSAFYVGNLRNGRNGRNNRNRGNNNRGRWNSNRGRYNGNNYGNGNNRWNNRGGYQNYNSNGDANRGNRSNRNNNNWRRGNNRGSAHHVDSQHNNNSGNEQAPRVEPGWSNSD